METPASSTAKATFVGKNFSPNSGEGLDVLHRQATDNNMVQEQIDDIPDGLNLNDYMAIVHDRIEEGVELGETKIEDLGLHIDSKKPDPVDVPVSKFEEGPTSERIDKI